MSGDGVAAEGDEDDDSVGTQEYDDLDGLQRAENIGQTEEGDSVNRYRSCGAGGRRGEDGKEGGGGWSRVSGVGAGRGRGMGIGRWGLS